MKLKKLLGVLDGIIEEPFIGGLPEEIEVVLIFLEPVCLLLNGFDLFFELQLELGEQLVHGTERRLLHLGLKTLDCWSVPLDLANTILCGVFCSLLRFGLLLGGLFLLFVFLLVACVFLRVLELLSSLELVLSLAYREHVERVSFPDLADCS